MKLAPLATLTSAAVLALSIVAMPFQAATGATTAAAANVTLYASPDGSGTSCSSAAPCSIAQAQANVRAFEAAPTGDITVLLAGGTYRITSPLTFGPEDGGRAGSQVTWRNQSSEKPVITGATPVTGWSVHDAANGIYVADTPVGVETRQLYVDGLRAQRASIPLANSDVTLTPIGFTINNPALNYLSTLPKQTRMELNGTGAWSDRWTQVASISGNTVTMAQPGWDNNTWGWDTIQAGFHGPTLTLENSLNFLRNEGQWYIDPDEGKLYYKPAAGVDPSSLDVELPRLESLVHIGGTYDTPLTNLTFQGIQFSGTSWLAPSSKDGYANQQNGTFVKGAYPYRPADAFNNCNRGCSDFERARTTWLQEPAAVQVSAASQVTFLKNTFTNLGQSALGIGMDANAHATGVGLGTSNINVLGNTFTQVGGHGVVAGGVRADAHHPSDPRMLVSNILIQNNTITKVAQDYKDNSGILTTYVTNARIVQNEVSDVPYDGIDTGFGWGVNDPGGSEDYRNRGYYIHNPMYSTKTTLANNVVAFNLVHGTKTGFADGGSIYNLSASPGTVYRNNYIYDLRNTIGLYFDEGSRYMKAQYNVIQDSAWWIFANTNGAGGTTNETKDNNLDNNFHNTGGVLGRFDSWTNNTVTNDRPVSGAWPTTAQVVMCEAGVAPALRTAVNANYSADGYRSCGAWGSHVSAPYLTTATSAASSYFAQEGGDQFAIAAAGADVWRGGPQTDDAYGAIYQAGSVSSGTSVTARVDAQNDPHPFAKTGLMIRNDMTKPGSSAGYAILAVTPANGVVFEWDSNADGYVDSESKVAIDTQRPITLRMDRSGEQVTAFYSLDGVEYRQIGSAVTLPGIAATGDGGVFSTSHDTTRAATNYVSDLQITTGLAPALRSFATGASQITQNGSQISLGANGKDVFQGGAQYDDAYGSVYLPGAFSNGKTVSTKVVSQADTNPWAKTGIMVKNSIAAPGYAPGYAVLAVTPANGVLLEWDSDGNGYIDSESKVSIPTNRPIWLKLTRNANQVTGFYSTDGVTYLPVGSAVTLRGIAATADAGVFSTSHDARAFASNVLTAPTITGVPDSPAVTGVTAGNGAVDVAWTAPASDGGSPITQYTVTSSPEGKTCSSTTATACRVEGLTNGTAYTFTVTAQNANGTSPASAPSASVTPQAVVVTPATSPAANAAGWHNAPVDVSFSTPAAGVTIQSRVVGSESWSDAQPVRVTAQGSTKLDYRGWRSGSVVAGSQGQLEVKLDSVAPVSSAVSDPVSGTVQDGQTVTARFSAVDATSGVAFVEYSSDGGATWTRSTDAGVSFTESGTHTVSYRAVDVAGNTEQAKSIVLTVGTPSPSPSPTAGPTTGPTASPSPSATPGTKVVASTTRVEQGGSFTVTVTGLTPGEQIAATLYSTPLPITGIPAADASGAVTFRVNVPASTPTGAHTLVLTRANGSELNRLAIEVVRPGALAVTGAELPWGLALGAAGILVAGGLLLTRRPRTRTS